MKNKPLFLKCTLAFIIIILVICGCTSIDNQSDTLSASSKPINLVIDTYNDNNDNTIFNFSAEDFIKNFNNIYNIRNSDIYLADLNEWHRFDDFTLFYGYSANYYRFSIDEKVWTKPTISLYLPENEHGIFEFKLSFDDHGYNINSFKEFKEMCFCTFKVMLPNLDDNSINLLFNELYDQTNKNFWNENKSDTTKNLPEIETLYYIDNVGIYGYYSMGSANICIIPMSKNDAEKLFEYGIELTNIK